MRLSVGTTLDVCLGGLSRVDTLLRALLFQAGMMARVARAPQRPLVDKNARAARRVYSHPLRMYHRWAAL